MAIQHDLSAEGWMAGNLERDSTPAARSEKGQRFLWTFSDTGQCLDALSFNFRCPDVMELGDDLGCWRGL
jgi:hypothetical protein